MKPVRMLSIFDTTLRDGEQAPGNSMTVDQKVEMASRLEALGVDIIEGGFPASSPVDFDAVQRIAKQLTRARLCAFARARRDDIDSAVLALKDPSRVQLQTLAVGSDIHLKYKRRITRNQAISEAASAISYAKAKGFEDISLGIEDASRGNREFLKNLSNAAVDAGATTLVIADTVGCLLPEEAYDLVSAFRSWFPTEIKLSGHFHDDMGLALANALSAVKAGADEIQTTLGGIGERAGNTAVEELATVLRRRNNEFLADTRIDLSHLYVTSQRLAEIIRHPVPRNKAVIGEFVFSTEAGIHQSGILKNPETYEYLDPVAYGRERRLIIGRHSGRAGLRHLLKFVGLEPLEPIVERLYQKVLLGEVTELTVNPTKLILEYRKILKEKEDYATA